MSSSNGGNKKKIGLPMAGEDSDKSSLLRSHGHSRESSGTSNLSVKFTVTQSSDGGSPIASATVSADTTPLHEGGDSSKPPLPSVVVRNPNNTSSSPRHAHRKKKRNRRQRTAEPGDLELSDAGSPDEHVEGESGRESDGDCDCQPNESAERTNGENCDRLVCGRVGPSVEGMLSGADTKSQNGDYGSFCNTPRDNYFPSSKMNPAGGPEGVKSCAKGSCTAASKGEPADGRETNGCCSRKPLLDNAASDSSCSDDDAGANSSGYTRRKTRFPQRSAAGGASVAAGSAVCIDIASETEPEEREVHIPGEPLKTFVAFVFLFFAWVATTTSLALTHDRVPQEAPLPDIFLDNTTYQPWGLSVSEIIIMVSVMSAFIVTLFHKHRCVVLRRIFLLVGLHYYYRAITMFITVVPKANPNYECAPQLNSTEITPLIIAQRVLKLLSGFGMSINGKHVYCGDYIYSGHTMTLIMTYLVIRAYSPKNWYLLHAVSFCTSAAGVLFLLLARGHYSIDVVIAYWITTRLWWMYHSMSNNRVLKDGKNSHNFLRNMWWWNLFVYFECNIPIVVPREYSWPVPNRLLRVKPFSYLASCGRRDRQSATSPPPPPSSSSSSDGELNRQRLHSDNDVEANHGPT